MEPRSLKRLATRTACVTTLAGAGLAAMGGTAAFAATTATATSTSSYTCSLTGIIPLTEAGALSVTAPVSGVAGSTVEVGITAPQGTATSPVAITSLTISGAAAVAGDGPVTTLPFSGTSGPSAAGAAPPAVPTAESLTLPRQGRAVTVTLPTSYTLSINLGFGTEAGTCTTTSPGSVTIAVTCPPRGGHAARRD
jgi:hypothetical protein